jgi:hypothetical protein
MSKKLTLPPSTNPNQIETVIHTERTVVVIGANGSGKTRLGTWIEFSSDCAEKVHRVSAQKSLSIPPVIHPEPVDRAKEVLRCGYYNEKEENWAEHRQHHKKRQRWRENPETHLLSDFEQLLTYLFSENYEEALKFIDEARATQARVEPPATKLDRTKALWEYLLPHRELVLRSGTIDTKIKGAGDCYKASQMSDGERVIFYLIGQCLSAPEDGVLVIDEPEMHLHRSIQRKLWDAIEKERADCIFVYLTHDLDFAATRFDSIKICLNGFDGRDFDWYEVSREEAIPESVWLEVIGSRSPILFVEGSDGSYDIQVYQHVYPDFTIKPLGSYRQVIEAVKVFNSLETLHHVKAFGIIDRDYRDDEHLKNYEKNQVYSTPVAEVENILLSESILRSVADQLVVPDPEATVNEIKGWVIAEFDRLKTKYALEATSHTINIKLNGFDGNAGSIEELETNASELKASVDARQIYQAKLGYADEVIQKGAYWEVLRIFKHKALLSQVGKFYGIKPNGYAQKVKDIIVRGNPEILEFRKSVMPQLI